MSDTANTKLLADKTSDCKIIPFPIERIHRQLTPDGFNEKLAEHKIEFINFVVDKHVNALLNRLAMEGVDSTDPKCIADFVFIFEVVRSALYRCYNIDHPLQEFVDMNFGEDIQKVLDDIPGHGTFKLQDDEEPFNFESVDDESEDDDWDGE